MNEDHDEEGAPGGPRPLTSRSTHDLVIDMLRRDYPRGGSGVDFLDAPCGAGALSVRMRDLGFNVTCCDIDRGNFEASGFEHIQADLNARLPMADRRFDGIISVAGIQRLHDPHVAIGEFHRLLKPGGVLYLGVPHLASLRKRLRFLLYGTIGPLFDNPTYIQTLSAPEANFRFPLMYPRVERMVGAAGFEIREVRSNPRDLQPYVLFPLSLAACAASWIRSVKNPAKYSSYRRATNMGMLRSNSYVVVARKNG
jgi:SAM-dependent methyltransferase